MTVLAVVSLFGALALDRSGRRMEKELREAARNQQMFEAIQRAQLIVDEVSNDHRLDFNSDQTLQFGDDLVHFQLNSVEPDWRAEGQRRLLQFCKILQEKLSKQTENGVELREFFAIEVEGHTDSSQCSGDPHCNWWISSSRAAVFTALMRQGKYCPGGFELKLRSVGLADSRPLATTGNPEANRRIVVKLLPDYQRIIGVEEER